MAHPATLNRRGYWRALQRYRAGDVVVIDGVTYVCMKDHRARWWRRPALWSRGLWVVMAFAPRQRAAVD